MSRLDTWNKRSWHVPILTYVGETETTDRAIKRIQDALEEDENGTYISIVQTAKEVVFDVEEDGAITLTPVSWLLHLPSNEQAIAPVYEVTLEHPNAAKAYMAVAILFDVPIVPNREAARTHLQELISELLAEGFDISDVEGKSERRVFSALVRFDKASDEERVRALVQPGEVVHLLDSLDREIRANASAKAVLSRVRNAIEELSELLARETSNEHDLQRCLTKYPIFFGPSYRRVIPKHRLGSEYEVDYALEFVDGSIDVVEIESSVHRLYNKNGDPARALVHAEQQVLDWLAWLDEHSPYARAKLPGVRRACGIVVIGRRSSMSREQTDRLAWRNMMYGGRLTILTFDDVLDRCRTLQKLLSSDEVTES